MANKFHINDNGEPAKCDAVERPCPKGGADVHGSTPEEAQEKFEKKMKDQETVSLQKPKKNNFQFATDKQYFPESSGVEVIHHTDNAETLKEANRLAKSGKFVVITEQEELVYDYTEEPDEDDFDDEEEYEDMMDEYDHQIDLQSNGDETPLRAEYSTKAIGYENREEFLKTIKDDSNDLVNGNSNSIMILGDDKSSNEKDPTEAYSASDYDSGNDTYFNTKVTVFYDNETK